ncbi:MAG: hypoxanthine phosphoribosyltransferase [Deltaproteobacteria bacterium]|nr:MAG: hypoxanthine phosphoribosyltransferase [Deltaproteobacteria bacterium]
MLIPEAEVRSRVEALARQISEDYAAVDELLLVGVLKGAFIFLADLSRCLTIPRSIDFIAVSSYAHSSRTSGAVRLVMDLRTPIEGRHVLVVEDILETGYTLEYLVDVLAARKPASLKTCVLVRKQRRQKVQATVDYLGFEIPDVWVVGYGLDYAERNRTLPYIGVIEPDDRSA